jgi:excisionase family DNA binding protein
MNTTLTDTLLTTDEVAAKLRVAPRTLRQWRDDGRGPRPQRIGRMIRYRSSDVQKWLDDQLQGVSHT